MESNRTKRHPQNNLLNTQKYTFCSETDNTFLTINHIHGHKVCLNRRKEIEIKSHITVRLPQNKDGFK